MSPLVSLRTTPAFFGGGLDSCQYKTRSFYKTLDFQIFITFVKKINLAKSVSEFYVAWEFS